MAANFMNLNGARFRDLIRQWHTKSLRKLPISRKFTFLHTNFDFFVKISQDSFGQTLQSFKFLKDFSRQSLFCFKNKAEMHGPSKDLLNGASNFNAGMFRTRWLWTVKPLGLKTLHRVEKITKITSKIIQNHFKLVRGARATFGNAGKSMSISQFIEFINKICSAVQISNQIK